MKRESKEVESSGPVWLLSVRFRWFKICFSCAFSDLGYRFWICLDSLPWFSNVFSLQDLSRISRMLPDGLRFARHHICMCGTRKAALFITINKSPWQFRINLVLSKQHLQPQFDLLFSRPRHPVAESCQFNVGVFHFTRSSIQHGKGYSCTSTVFGKRYLLKLGGSQKQWGSNFTRLCGYRLMEGFQTRHFLHRISLGPLPRIEHLYKCWFPPVLSATNILYTH